MSKDLPYFRFYPSEWQNGDITLEDYENQGIFIKICCYYWISDCSITLAKLKRRLNGSSSTIEYFVKIGIIKHTQETDFIEISFLDEQFDLLSERRKSRQKAGKKGGKVKPSKAQAKLKQNSSYKDKDKEKDKEYKEKFETFWKIYPLRNGKKVGKKKSIELFMKISFDELDNVINGAKVYGVNNQFPKDPERFLRDDIWKDLEGEPNGSSWEKTCKESEKLQKYARGEA